MNLPAGQRVVVHAWGETPMQTLDQHITLEPQPAPTALGPDEVLLRVRSCAVGWVDLIMSSGQYQHRVSPPYTPGLEFAGDVVAVGADVSTVSVGDPVLADGLHTGPRSAGQHQDGGFATYAVIPQSAALPLPRAAAATRCRCHACRRPPAVPAQACQRGASSRWGPRT